MKAQFRPTREVSLAAMARMEILEMIHMMNRVCKRCSKAVVFSGEQEVYP